jgi:hypothetical protein
LRIRETHREKHRLLAFGEIAPLKVRISDEGILLFP